MQISDIEFLSWDSQNVWNKSFESKLMVSFGMEFLKSQQNSD